jgi:hypothetical protein
MNNANGKNSTPLFISAFVIFLLLSVATCKPKSNDLHLLEQAPIADFHPYAQSVVVALNFGGPEYKASDGVLYSADSLNVDSAVGYSAEIKGSQDAALYRTYRVATAANNIALQFPLDNARYALTFMLARDNNILSSLVKTVTGVEVTDGILNLELIALKGQPIIHAMLIRKTPNDTRNWQHNIWPARKVNSEDQAYTNREKNARVENGMLIIRHLVGDMDAALKSVHVPNFMGIR